MTENNSISLKAVIQYALPLGAVLITGNPDKPITYAITVRAQPPAFPDVYGGELALVAMDVVRSLDSRITLEDVIKGLAAAGVSAVATQDEIATGAIESAAELGMALIGLPEDCNLSRIERSVNALVINQKAQMQQRAIEIQRQLTRLAAENRDFSSLLQIIARSTGKAVIVHDDAGVLMAQVYPTLARRAPGGGVGRTLLQSLPYSAFQTWLNRDAPTTEGAIVSSPLGYTTPLKVEKRVAGYMSLVGSQETLDDFDRLVLTYGADVCAIELAKIRAIASAVEQARGDWIQMWLSGTPADDDLMTTRAQQAGFDPTTPYVVVVFRAATAPGTASSLDALLPLVRDDMTRRQIPGAVGQYVDVIVALYPLEASAALARLRGTIEEVRRQLAQRSPTGLVGAGISRLTHGLAGLRDAYREAKDAVSIAAELGNKDATTYYGDLKLFQFLLALKERNLDTMRRFCSETLGPLIEHDERKQGDLIRTLNGYFDANGNLAKAAADLAVHRNTLVYRLERIAELTGLNLDDPDNRLILNLALKVQRVLATLPS